MLDADCEFNSKSMLWECAGHSDAGKQGLKERNNCFSSSKRPFALKKRDIKVIWIVWLVWLIGHLYIVLLLCFQAEVLCSYVLHAGLF